MPAGPTTARLAALDELARSARRRPLFRRARLHDVVDPAPSASETGRVAGADHGAGGGVDAEADRVVRRQDRPQARASERGTGAREAARGFRTTGFPRWAAPALALLVMAVAAGSWILLRRPPTPEASLPRATAGAAGASSTALDPTTAPSAAGGPAPNTVPGTRGAEGPVLVHVAGAVARPGVVSLPAGSRAVDAVTAAGGMAAGADPDRVNLAARLVDGERLIIPLVGQPPPVEVVPVGGVPDAASGADGAAAGGPVDLNSGTAEQLDALPGVGPATAAAIISHRQKNGPFTSVDGLLDVRGIGDAKLEALRDLVTVSSS